MKLETKTKSGTKVMLISGDGNVTAIFDHPQLGHIERKGTWREGKMKVVLDSQKAVIWLTVPKKDYDKVYSQCTPLPESSHHKKERLFDEMIEKDQKQDSNDVIFGKGGW